MSKELLLEIGTEEIPSVYLKDTLEEMRLLAEKMFEQHKIGHKGITVHATPRRLILYIDEVNEKQDIIEQKIFGPPKNRAYDMSGNPTQAACGFAKKQGISTKELKTEMTKKGEYLYTVKSTGGRDTDQIFKVLLSNFITNIPFPKTMRWNNGDARFVRPIHWILALSGKKIVRFNLNGIKSSNRSCGHRFMSPGTFTVYDAKDYFKKTAEHFVEIDHQERKASIVKQINHLTKKIGGQPVMDKSLLDSVSFLVEYPVAIMGTFDKKYLNLPEELLITTMKKHQRYFSVRDKHENLLPYFITIANIKPHKKNIISSGNERVLSARFYDAHFFLKEDKKIPFHNYTHKLKTVLFQEQLGTIYEKTERIISLSLYLVRIIDKNLEDTVKKAALLCKADLVTRMVYEFPVLQGIMGREYAKASGETDEVATAIYEHYLPRFAQDSIPASLAGAIVGISDRIDTIAGCFGIGLSPTGSQDPHALRRQALAIINIIVDKKIDINLLDLIDRAINTIKDKFKKEPSAVRADVIDFIKLRFKGLMEAAGYPYDIIDAVLSADCSDLVDAQNKIYVLSDFRADKDFESLTTAFKRTVNILSSVSPQKSADPRLFTNDHEKTLHKTFYSIKDKAQHLIKKKEYGPALSEIAKIRNAVDAFFDNVMVMEKDEKIKNNRLGLLNEISEMFSKIADFSKIILYNKIS